MAFHFFDIFKAKDGKQKTVEVSCKELFEAAREFQIRNLCFWICVDMIANAMGRCEFRTFRNNQEIQEREYYLWNFEPNKNQNSTMFIHKLISKLYEENEALIVNVENRNGVETLAVADDWQEPQYWPDQQNQYTSVQVGELIYNKTFREKDVLHLKLNHCNIKTVIDGMYRSYYQLIHTAMKNYQWENGQHWKVHVAQLASGEDGWAEKFQKMIEAQIKPFLESNGAVLPEFDGYEYTNVGGTRTSTGGTRTSDTRDIRALVEDNFDFTARGFLIPAVLVNGKVEGTADANKRFLTNCIDPICDQLQEEIVRKRYGYEEWRAGNFLRIDSSSIIHFDLFENAANVEKLVGSGAYTINDVRRAANQSTITEPWADEHFMTLNISRMSQSARPLDAQKGGNNE